jgi:hypothetical protein
MTITFEPKPMPVPRGRDAQPEPTIYRMPIGVCAYCDAHRHETMMPSHTPSKNCESGKRPHCTCDVCF